ncbi:MAG: hypothetical protein Alis3KO_14950 [Aliiglaciecola sp.]|uniref:hypothetical protein n=1 Tax=Aliiglaciecola sp. M165 TaxID=2593649 RepID=UPI00117E7A8D|nr:hypothetical protein [Aliiglaciecola sp. M165]TRY32824.1 hypothetical protein FM019_02215 [Aliiglaciecola sp. M165]
MLEAILFGLTVFSFVIGVSCVIMGFIPSPAGGMREKVEYSFFGVTGLVIGLLLLIALMW